MNLLNILLQAPAANGAITQVVMIVAIIAVFYFFMIRPQSKKQKELKNFRDALSVGDKVMSAGGIFGRVKEIQEDAIVLTVADGVHIRISKDSIYAQSGDNKQA